MLAMLVASLVFLGTHAGLSSTPLRGRLVAILGERGFLAVFSLIAAVSISYLIWLYNTLPRFDYLWMPSPERYMTAKLLMPLAVILAAGGFLVKNPTNVGAERMLTENPEGGRDLARGLTRITRHPFQWGVLIWSLAHMLANGDRVSVIFFATFGILAGFGTVLIDRKKAQKLGEQWSGYAAVTSNIPFAAILGGRNRLVLRELWLPVALGLALYCLLLFRHEWVSGVRII
jgi:uncharacterized membrane protein